MKRWATGAHFVAGRGAHGGRGGLDDRHRLERKCSVIDFERENILRHMRTAALAKHPPAAERDHGDSELPETLLVTAGLCALLDMLEGDGLSRRDAKAFIARSLNALRE